jgi:hypothetical protein
MKGARRRKRSFFRLVGVFDLPGARSSGDLEIRPRKPPHMQTSLVSQCIAMLSFLSRLEIGSKDGPG